ncbi:MAG TPA: YfhO family protein, partial [Gemmatimonadales bacterium]|nr:YfhO family protein [Gemmatimonadales bacterium]
ALLYALGAGTPMFRLLYAVVPGLKNFRAPSLATYLVIVALTLLAALLIERVLAEGDSRARRAMSVGLASGAAGALLIAVLTLATGTGLYATWTSIFGGSEATNRAEAFAANVPRLTAGALIVALICGAAWGAVFLWSRDKLKAAHVVIVLTVLTALDLMRVDDRYIQIVSYDDFFPQDPGIEALRARLAPGERVLSVGGVYPEGFLASYGVPEVFGYHGNQLRWYNDLTRYTARQSARTATELEQYWVGFLSSAALRALAGKYVLLPGQVELPGFRLLGADERVAVYLNDAAMPGAAVVPEVQVEPDSARRISTLWSPTFDPARTAIVEAPVLALGQGGGTGTATIEGNGDDTLAVRVRNSGPGLLHISRTYHRSWQAEIDGVPVPVLRVNHALMGVPLTRSGEHRVVLRYRPTIVRLAATVTLITWGAVLLATLAGALMHLRGSRG